MVVFKKRFNREMEKLRNWNGHLKEETTSLKARVDILSKLFDEEKEKNSTLAEEVKSLKEYIASEFETIKQGLQKQKEEMLKKAKESKELFNEYLFGDEGKTK